MQERLIELLAETDALFEPIRSWKNLSNVAAVMERRADFHRHGLPVPRGGGDANERKRFEDQLSLVEETGQVVFHRISGRRTHWKLADATDWELRRLATWYDFPEVLTVMLAVRALTDAGYTNTGLVPDWSLGLAPSAATQSAKAREAVGNLARVAMAGLVRGWLAAWSDGQGANGYAISDAGRAILADPTLPTIEWPEYDVKANDSYLASLNDAETALAGKSSRSNHAAIPLSCGNWPKESSRKDLVSIYTRQGKVRTAAGMLRAIAKTMGPGK